MPLTTPYSLRLFAVGGLIGIIHAAYLYAFSAPLAEKLHEELIGAAEEEVATWLIPIVAFLLGGSLAYLLSLSVARGVEPGLAALAGFVVTALPTIKWLPTPHGVSYLEPVWWRESIHALYILANMAVLWAAYVARPRLGYASYVLASAVLAALFLAFPSFTLPSKYMVVVPELRALQGLALMGW